MCKFTGSFSNKSFTGYKVAVRELSTGKIRSSCMGFVYKPGKVPVIKRQRNLTMHYWTDDILKMYYSKVKDMRGRTAVFIHEESAVGLFSSIEGSINHSKYQVVLLLMKITGELLEGEYSFTGIVAGTHIESIEVLEEGRIS